MPARVLWPERFPLYDLMVKRASEGEGAFNTEQQNNPSDPSKCEWPPEIFDRPDIWFDQWPDGLAVKVVGLDPSKGADSKRGDASAIIMYGRTHDQREYADADIEVRPVDRICADCAKWVKRFNPDAFVLEGNSWQDLLAAPMREAFAEAGVEHVVIHSVINTAKKIVRIRRLTKSLVQRRLRFKSRSPGAALLVQQLRDFPHSAHDDGPDGLELARGKAIELWNG